jgi:hypothetical protein
VREFTKAAVSYGWSTTVFQMQQLLNVLSRTIDSQDSSATNALNAVAECTAQQLGPTLRGVYLTGDAMQRSVVNVMFGALGPLDCTPRVRRSDDEASCSAAVGSGDQVGARRIEAPGARPSWRDLRLATRPGPARVPAEGSLTPDAPGWGPMP